MDLPQYIVSDQKEESISAKRVKTGPIVRYYFMYVARSPKIYCKYASFYMWLGVSQCIISAILQIYWVLVSICDKHTVVKVSRIIFYMWQTKVLGISFYMSLGVS